MATDHLERTMRLLSIATLVSILGLLGTFAGTCWAQDETREPAGFSVAFEWNYSCPSSRGCAFNCPGAGGAMHTTKLSIYLGKLRVSESENAFALFYEFSTVEFPRGNGFAISTGLNTLSCQVNGMSLDYSGPPRKAQY
jgi:hypothetical protein